ncbi:MAG: M56 family metallopeptidase [Saprospiraceae bacterium]
MSITEDRIVSEGCVIVNMKDTTEPCSFFKYIFINPATYDYNTYEQILTHEKIHVRKFHSLDLLVSELAVILLWFNPFIWLIRKEIEKNIEYQTDDILVKDNTSQKKKY